MQRIPPEIPPTSEIATMYNPQRKLKAEDFSYVYVRYHTDFLLAGASFVIRIPHGSGRHFWVVLSTEENSWTPSAGNRGQAHKHLKIKDISDNELSLRMAKLRLFRLKLGFPCS